jgi:predicted TIM-barrel fold metal-dependent hydrolase
MEAESEDWKWIPGMKPQLPEPFTLERALPLLDEAGIDRAVVVPPSWHGDRNDYALEAARRYPNRFAVMGRIPLQNPKSAELLAGLKAQPGMLGIRLTFQGRVKWLDDGTADSFGQWPKGGLPVMFLAPERARIAGIAERHPQLQLIAIIWAWSLDPAYKPAIRRRDQRTLALAKHQNVSVKLPGLRTIKEPYPYRDLNPHVKAVRGVWAAAKLLGDRHHQRGF